jgi:DNA polymerase III delta subunit
VGGQRSRTCHRAEKAQHGGQRRRPAPAAGRGAAFFEQPPRRHQPHLVARISWLSASGVAHRGEPDPGTAWRFGRGGRQFDIVGHQPQQRFVAGSGTGGEQHQSRSPLLERSHVGDGLDEAVTAHATGGETWLLRPRVACPYAPDTADRTVSWVNLHVFVGPEEVLAYAQTGWFDAQRAAGRDIERVSAGERAAVIQAVATNSLFGGERAVWIDGFDKLDSTLVDHFGPNVAVGGAAVKLGAALQRAVNGSVTTCNRAWVARQLERCFTERNVRLQPAARALLVERCGSDLGRVRSVATAAELAGIRELKADQAAKLLGTYSSEARAYEVIDTVLDGSVAAGVAAAVGLVDVLVTSQLASACAHVHAVASEGLTADELAAAFSLAPFIAKRRVSQARRYRPDQISAALVEACAADVAVRTGQLRGVDAVARVAGALAGGSSPHRG